MTDKDDSRLLIPIAQFWCKEDAEEAAEALRLFAPGVELVATPEPAWDGSKFGQVVDLVAPEDEADAAADELRRLQINPELLVPSDAFNEANFLIARRFDNPQSFLYKLLLGIGALLWSLALYSGFSGTLFGEPGRIPFAVYLAAIAALFTALALPLRRNPAREQLRRQAKIDAVATALTETKRPAEFCLYLRPFVTEGQLGHTRKTLRPTLTNLFAKAYETMELEQLLATAFSDLGLPQLAIGKPSSRFGSGLVTLPADDDGWREFVALAARQATAVLVVPGASEGTAWEVNLVSKEHLAKTLFVMPPAVEDYSWKDHWAAAVIRAKADGITLPPYDERGSLFWMIDRERVAETTWLDSGLSLGTARRMLRKFQRQAVQPHLQSSNL